MRPINKTATIKITKYTNSGISKYKGKQCKKTNDYMIAAFNIEAINIIGSSREITLLIKDDHLIIGIPDIDTKKTRTISITTGGIGSITLGDTWHCDIVGEYVFDEQEGDKIYFNKTSYILVFRRS